ncbi:MAG: nuclear transport factor 2 family protein [Pseudomonadota bacterium]
MNDDVEAMLDQAALRRTAEIYAQGADRRDKTAWESVLAENCVIEGPGFTLEGRDAILGSIDQLDATFRTTVHRVHQQLTTIDGDSATGETYSTAEHLLKDSDMILIWSIRYQDSWLRDGGTWRFTARTLIIDWEENRPVTLQGDTQ